MVDTKKLINELLTIVEFAIRMMCEERARQNMLGWMYWRGAAGVLLESVIAKYDFTDMNWQHARMCAAREFIDAQAREMKDEKS